MLYHSTVEPATLDLLKKLMVIPELDHCFLVGGTCLSLRYGHRLSVDLDLFSTVDFDLKEMTAVLENHFQDIRMDSEISPMGIFGFINGVKVDLVRHHFFKQIAPASIEEGIRMYSDDDIIAMKVFAILKRARKKDFWDVAELLQHYPVSKFISSYNEKYPNHQVLISIPRALIYFEEADTSENPISLKGQTWESVKKTISQKVSDYLK